MPINPEAHAFRQAAEEILDTPKYGHEEGQDPDATFDPSRKITIEGETQIKERIVTRTETRYEMWSKHDQMWVIQGRKFAESVMDIDTTYGG